MSCFQCGVLYLSDMGPWVHAPLFHILQRINLHAAKGQVRRKWREGSFPGRASRETEAHVLPLQTLRKSYCCSATTYAYIPKYLVAPNNEPFSKSKNFFLSHWNPCLQAFWVQLPPPCKESYRGTICFTSFYNLLILSTPNLFILPFRFTYLDSIPSLNFSGIPGESRHKHMCLIIMFN